MLKLRFKNNKHNAVWLVEPKVSIGCASGNDLVIDDPDVASQHAEILVKHEKLTLVNTGGQALYVNREPVEESVDLNINDQLLLGKAQLEVIDPKLEQRAPPAPATSENTGWALKGNHTALSNRVFAIKPDTVIGRSNECDITLAAAHLSRRHVKLLVREGLLYVKDLGSANGTFLNGERVLEARVRRGDELRFDTLSFGVIGPSSADLDKTSVRPVSAVAPPRAESGKPKTSENSPGRSGPGPRPSKPRVRGQRSATGGGGEFASVEADRAPGKGKLAWALAALVAIALAAGLAWQQGLFTV